MHLPVQKVIAMDRGASGSLPDYYARLGVRPSASAKTIQEAYRKKARETHPDLNPEDPEAEEHFQKIQKAYRVLRDPERREEYDAARQDRRGPSVLTINQQAPAGCGGYLWRVFAGVVAVGVFFVLEAMGVWAAGTWTILLAVGGAAIVASLIAVAVANRFPEEATDVGFRLTREQLTMWADGRAVLQLPWSKVEAVRLRGEGWGLELVVQREAVQGLQRIPPVLTTVDRRPNRARLQFDLSDTDVRRNVLLSFLRSNDSIPFTTSGGKTSSKGHPTEEG